MENSEVKGDGDVGVTAEKLAIMKLNLNSHDTTRDFFSEPTTPTGIRKATGFATGGFESSSRSLAHSSRQISRSSRRQSSFVSSHRSKMSLELATQAETKFFALMELMASASREASSLKESWAKIAEERNSFTQERAEILEELSEVSQELERKSSEQHKHGREANEGKKQVERLLLELSAAVAGVTIEKKKVTERDLELGRARHELHEARETIARSRIDHEKVRSQVDVLEGTLRATEIDRDTAREAADTRQRELVKVTRERTDINSRLTDIIAKFDLSRKEVLSTADRLKMNEMELQDRLLEVERHKEDARKARLRADEASKDLIEIAEKHERLQREILKHKESIQSVESERDEYAHTVEHLRRELKTATSDREEIEERHSETSLKYEHIKRELLGLKERLRNVELERNDIQELVERSREQHRLIVIERDELKDDIGTANGRAEDSRRQVITLTDTLRKTEQNLVDIRSEVYTLTQRISRIDIERDEARTKNDAHLAEIAKFKERILALEAEIRTIADAHDRTRHELEKKRREYEEITETITEYNNDNGELEFEIESLRIMLSEAREQKERAITARNAADRERDEHISKYDAKCRQMEQFEESAASHYHAHARGEGRLSSSRVVSRNSTTVNHNRGEETEE